MLLTWNEWELHTSASPIFRRRGRAPCHRSATRLILFCRRCDTCALKLIIACSRRGLEVRRCQLLLRLELLLLLRYLERLGIGLKHIIVVIGIVWSRRLEI